MFLYRRVTRKLYRNYSRGGSVSDLFDLGLTERSQLRILAEHPVNVFGPFGHGRFFRSFRIFLKQNPDCQEDVE
jgi:hypothetical protein